MKAFLLIVLKNAVNAALITAPQLVWDNGAFNLHSWPAFLHVLELVGSAIIAREGMVWGPVLLKWSTSDAVPDSDILPPTPPANPLAPSK